jgi:ferredoxin
MGHLAAKNAYRKLGRKIDGLSVHAPWNQTLYSILQELYSSEEAEVVVKMPFGLAVFDQITKSTKIEPAKLQKILNSLCAKGLVMDIWVIDKYFYMISPMMVGIFEFTMMRTGGNINSKQWGQLFHQYLQNDNEFYKANFGNGQVISPLRALPYEDAIDKSGFVEILDYEKASTIVDQAKKFTIGICSCRHEKLHAGAKTCDIPLETCSTFDNAADYMAKHGFAKAVSKTEMLENLARSKELGLVLCADNVKNDITFICHCCGCCCNVLLGVSKFGFSNTIVTSTFIANHDNEKCSACGTCADSCPIQAIEINPDNIPRIDESICLGCGVCGVKCPSGALTLAKRQHRVLHPENTMQRVVLQCLERGTLQNLMFTDPQKLSHKFMRTFIGAFIKIPPVKRALMGDSLRSSFLEFIQKGSH